MPLTLEEAKALAENGSLQTAQLAEAVSGPVQQLVTDYVNNQSAYGAMGTRITPSQVAVSLERQGTGAYELAIAPGENADVIPVLAGANQLGQKLGEPRNGGAGVLNVTQRRDEGARLHFSEPGVFVEALEALVASGGIKGRVV